MSFELTSKKGGDQLLSGGSHSSVQHAARIKLLVATIWEAMKRI